VLVEAHEAEALERILSPYYDLAEELTKGWDLLYKARKPVCRPDPAVPGRTAAITAPGGPQ